MKLQAPMHDAELSTGTGRLALTSGAAQLGSRLFDVAVTWLLSIVVLRYLAPSGFGDYSLIVGLTGLAGVFAEFGLPQVATREIARDPSVEPGVIGSAIIIRFGLGLFSMLAVQLMLSFYDPTPTLRLATLIATSAFLIDAVLSIVVVFHVRLVQHLEALARFVGTVVRATLTVIAVTADWGLVGLMTAQLVALATVAATGIYLLTSRTSSRPTIDRGQVRTVARAAMAVGPAALVGVIYLKLDVIMLGLLETRESVGIYGAAYQPIEYLFLLTVVAVQVLLPLAAAVALTNQVQFAARYRFGANLLVAAYGAMAVGIVSLADDTVHLLYDTPFAGSADPMMVLGLALGFMAINAWQGVILLTIGQQLRNLVYLSIAALTNVAIDAVLIPAYGFIGAAYGTLITAVGLVTMSTIGLRRHAALTFGRGPGVLFVAAALGCGISFGLSEQFDNTVVSLVGGMAVWVAIAWAATAEILEGARDIAKAQAPVPIVTKAAVPDPDDRPSAAGER